MHINEAADQVCSAISTTELRSINQATTPEQIWALIQEQLPPDSRVISEWDPDRWEKWEMDFEAERPSDLDRARTWIYRNCGTYETLPTLLHLINWRDIDAIEWGSSCSVSSGRT